MVKWNGKWDALVLWLFLLAFPLIAMFLAIVMSMSQQALLGWSVAAILLSCFWYYWKSLKSKKNERR
ncbi:MAG: hypothetical protein GXY41_07930 [Phycisphaerae bacterium]|nr:hypothetical protein [Phycisphaerae bacterium]